MDVITSIHTCNFVGIVNWLITTYVLFWGIISFLTTLLLRAGENGKALDATFLATASSSSYNLVF